MTSAIAFFEEFDNQLPTKQDIPSDQVTMKHIKDDYNELIYQFSKFEKTISSTATEGIISKVAFNISDLILRLFNNLQSMITNVFKTLDRSELKAYIDSNRVSVFAVLKKNYSDISNIEVAEFPFSMDKMKMADMTSAYFYKLSMKKRIKDINKLLINIYSKMLNKKQLSNEIKTLQSLLSTDVATDIFSMIKKYTVIDGKIVSKFGDMFSSMNEFNSYYKKVLSSSDELNNAIKTSNIIEKKTYSILEKFNKSLSNDSSLVTVFKKSGKDFAKDIYNLGYLIDAYGHLAKHYHHMEHNVVNILKVLIKESI